MIIKIQTYIIALLTGIMLGGCSDHHISRELDNIAMMVYDEPDSTIALLDSLAPHIGTSPAMRARHATLRAYAALKADNEMPDRETTERTAEYFLSDPTPATLFHALAFYMLGQTQEADSLYAKSLVAYAHAEQAAKATGDHHLLGLIYRGTADVYDDIYNAVEAVHYGMLSLREFQKGSPQPYADYAMLDLALYYYSAGDYARSLTYTDSIIRRATENGDMNLFVNAYAVVGNIAIMESRYDDAIKTYSHILETTDSLGANEVGNFATSLIRTGRVEDAGYYLDRFVPKTSEYAHLYADYNVATGNYADAIKGMQHDVAVRDSVIHTVLAQNVSSNVRESFENETKILDQKIRTNRGLLISISIIAILAIVLFGYIHRSRMLQKSKQTAEAMATAQGLIKELSSTKVSLDATKASLNSLFAGQLEIVDNLCDSYYEATDSPKQKALIYNRLMELLRKLGDDANTLTRMEELINRNHGNVMMRFREDFPDLKSKDYQRMMYIIMGLSPRTVAVLMDMKINTVYVHKSTLKKMVQSATEERRDRYLGFF
ncbi:MAG: hypothetical protein K2M97_00175 [Muribaculaceae bacterium]|nr:hypothetical protein [Muribaculaceae bacterium]